MMPESLSEQPVGQTPAIRRSFTLPTKLNPPARRGSAAPKLSENVIFYHPSAKIVHFAPRALAPIPSSSAPADFDYPVDTIESLPWRSATERTVATAPLRLERVHGLTAFLKCGNVVHAILKNSQCWCVDGVSKFVLRIRPLTYYRIEIPHETDEDQALVVDLKTALPTILRYEVTPCPFKRAFTVELPEDAMAPRRKKAWRPKERKDSLFPASGSSQGSPSETRSEWLDSASTGEDTDGGTTDDSALARQKTNSSTSEAVQIRDQSPSPSPIDKIEFPSPPKSIRRSATETPQTFTSLLARFDSAPVPEEGVAQTPEDLPVVQQPEDTVARPEPISIPEVKVEPALEPIPNAQSDSSMPKQTYISTPETPRVAESVSVFESNASAIAPDESESTMRELQAEPIPVLKPEPSEVPQIENEVKEEPISEAITTADAPASLPETPEVTIADTKPISASTPVADSTPVSEPQATLKPSALSESKEETTSPPDIKTDTTTTPVHIPKAEPEFAPEAAPETNVAPEAKAEPLSVPEPEIASDNNTIISPPATKADPISCPPSGADNVVEPTSGQDHDSSFSSTPESFHSVDAASPSDSVSTHTPPLGVQTPDVDQPKQKDDPSLEPIGISANPVTHGFAPQVDGSSSRSVPTLAAVPTQPQPQSSSAESFIKGDSSKSSLAIPSAKPSSATPVKSSPPTDFNHMSSEFRRRSKATRERDVSPMPPPSAIYQPKAGDHASSFITKALTLVLVPPVTLFIVLLHVAARIVISPALNSSLEGPSQGSRSSGKKPAAEDDFSFPLEHESSSEYEDAEINKKLDPWDLD